MNNSNDSWINDIKLVGWDLDGTLYPPSPIMSEEIDDLKIATVADTLGISFKGAQKKFEDLYAQLGSNTSSLDKIGIDGQQFFVDVWKSLNLDRYIKPNPELVSALRLWRERSDIKHLILTNSNTQETVIKKLSCIGLTTEDFDAVYTSIDIGYQKPDKNAFKCLLEFNDESRPENILYVGDRVKTDLEPAKELGMRTALITNDKQPKATENIDVVTTTPIDLINFFN